MVKENERIDDLQRNGYRLIQNPDYFCFGMDAVLLSTFANVGAGKKALDMGTGNGVIPILMEAKNPGAKFCGLEIQKECADIARRNVVLNKLEESISIECGDIKEAVRIYGQDAFDVITTNPPYMNENHGIVNPDSAKAIARHELKCNLEDIISQAAKCLKVRGHFYMVHRPARLVEIFALMHQYKLEPKRMRMIYPYINKEANMVLIEAVKGGRALLTNESPLIVYNADGSYTEQLLKMYN